MHFSIPEMSWQILISWKQAIPVPFYFRLCRMNPHVLDIDGCKQPFKSASYSDLDIQLHQFDVFQLIGQHLDTNVNNVHGGVHSIREFHKAGVALIQLFLYSHY
jgi:hypothetical protein